MICCSWPIITTCKSVSAIFVLLTDPEVVAVVGIAFGGILIDLVFLFYYNCGSDYITQWGI